MNDEDYLRIFLKMAPSDYRLIQKKTDLEPYWKPGFKFSLFTSEKNKDSFYTKGKESLEVELDSFRSIRRALKKSKSGITDSIKLKEIDIQSDSISKHIENNRIEFNKKGDIFEEEKQVKTINAFLGLLELEINDIDIKDDLDCYFFQHSNNDEKGIMCLYPMDSLALGKNELYYLKEYRSKNNSRVIDFRYKLPFYKVRNYN